MASHITHGRITFHVIVVSKVAHVPSTSTVFVLFLPLAPLDLQVIFDGAVILWLFLLFRSWVHHGIWLKFASKVTWILMALFAHCFLKRLLRSLGAHINLLHRQCSLWVAFINWISAPSTCAHIRTVLRDLFDHCVLVVNSFFLQRHVVLIFFWYFWPVHLSNVFSVILNFLVLFLSCFYLFSLFTFCTKNLSWLSQLVKNVILTLPFCNESWKLLSPLLLS